MSKTITEQFKEKLGIKSFVLKGLVGMQVAEALLNYKSLEAKISMMRQGVSGDLMESVQGLAPEVKTAIIEATLDHQKALKDAENLKDSARKANLLAKARELEMKIAQLGMESSDLIDKLGYKPAQQDLINQAYQAKISHFDFILSNLSAALKQEVTGLDELSPGQYNELINQLIKEPQNDFNSTTGFFG